MKPGIRVIRGPDWHLGDKDGGPGFLGTVVNIFPNNSVLVTWDIGTQTVCRAGLDGAFDLRLYDNAQIGTHQNGRYCDGEYSEKLDGGTIHGFRWKCLVCKDTEFCTDCYMSDQKDFRHQCVDTNHPFVRYMTPTSLVVRVPPRKQSKKIPLYGIFPGAEVTKAASSYPKNKLLGIVNELIDLQPDAYRSAVRVWVEAAKQKTKRDEPDWPIYRIGADGKVELKLITPASHGTVYIDHLPVLDLTMPVNTGFNVGDRVRVDLNLDTYKHLLSEYGSWNTELEKVLGVEGIVTEVKDARRRIVSTRHDSVGITVRAMYMNLLTKIYTLSAGDTVRIIQDQNKAIKLQVGHGGWQQTFVSILGATGHVVRVVDSEDAIVKVAGKLYVLNQSCLKLKQHGQKVSSLPSDADSRKRCFEVPEAIAEDPYYLNLYRTAIADGEEIDSRIRVNIVGNFFQGKSSLAKRLTGQDIKDVESTNTLQIYTCQASMTSRFFKLNVDKEENKEIARRLALATNLRTVRQLQNKSYDIEPLSTPTEVFPTAVTMQVIERPNAATVLKKDEIHYSDMFATQPSVSPQHAVNRQIEIAKPDNVSTEVLEIFKQEVENYDTKADDTFNVDLWDFGGQYIYYATHALFHSRDAVYLLVFDLTTSLGEILVDNEFPEETCNRTMAYFAKFWIQSIHSFVGSEDGCKPPVILVGTHKDKLQGDLKAKEEHADTYFSEVRELFKDTPLMMKHIQPKDFSVDNTDPTDISFANLREEISRLGNMSSEAKKIPCKWIPLEKALQNERHRKFVTLETVRMIDANSEFPLKDKDQIKLFLFYHHAKGTLFYFDDDKLSEYVMLDPQYLIDAFKSILTSDRYRTKDPNLIPLWRILKSDGRLESKLLDSVWERNGEPKFIKYKGVLLEFLKRQNIISEASMFDEESRGSKGLGWYIVPSMLKDHFSSKCLDNFLANKKQTLIRYVIRFEHASLIQLVFLRLLAAMAGKWACINIVNADTRLLFENLGVFRLNLNQTGIAEATDESIDLRLVSLNAHLETDRAEADRFRRLTESVIEYEFRKLKRQEEHFNTVPYKVCYRCNHETHGLTGSKTITELSELDGEKFVPCPDLLNHDCIPVDDAISQWIFDDKSICSPPNGTPLSEKQLGRIAQAIGKNWELLGYELGISKVEIEHISMDKYTTDLRIYRMLVLWTKRNDLATLDHLLRVMQKCNAVTIDWDKIRNMIEEMDMQQPETRSESRDGRVNIHLHRDNDKDDTVVEAREQPNNDKGDGPHSDRFVCESCEEDKPRCIQNSRLTTQAQGRLIHRFENSNSSAGGHVIDPRPRHIKDVKMLSVTP